MTTHLSPEQFVEAAEGTLAHAASSHLEVCGACRREVSDLVALMGDVQAASDRTEPSPLFWDHFSQRVQAATVAEPVPARSWWQAWRPIATLVAVAAMALLMVELRMPRAASRPGTPAVAGVPAAAGDDVELASALQRTVAGEDDAMDFVTELAADMPWDDLQQAAQPSRDVTAAAFGQLTPAQRAELARLVKAAMDGAE